MTVHFYRSLAEVPSDFGPSAVTIGKFDGIHIGHGRMIGQLLERAREHSLVSTVLTFDRNPLSLLNARVAPEPLISNDQKRELLAAAGLDATVMVPFDREFSEHSPEEFARDILSNALHARLVVVGPDFRFGKGGAGTAAQLAQFGERYGFEVHSVHAVTLDGDRAVSSTWVRQLLCEGRVAEASELLGRPHAVRGLVVHGAKRGRALGFPTANLAEDAEGFIVADGVYAGWLTAEGERMAAAISIGKNPTFEGVVTRQVEAFVLDREIDLYGQVVELSFVERVRGMEKFAGVPELIAQMGRDVDRVREILDYPTG